MSHDLNPDEQQDDVLFHITTLRMMSPGKTDMPKRWHEGFWRVMDRAHAEIVRLRAENRALRQERQ